MNFEAIAIDGDAMFVVGDPGSGKTLLLEHAALRASSMDMQVVAARGVEFEADMSFSGLNQVLLPMFEELGGLSKIHRDALSMALGLSDGVPPANLVVSNAVIAALREAASRKPVLLIVDDLPWIDRASALVLGFVARRLAGTHVGLLAAARTNQESFFNRGGMGELTLLPLDHAAGSELVHARFPTLSEGVHRQILEEAQGNPLALIELPTTLSEEQRKGRRALPSPLPQSRRLQTLFVSALEGLNGATRSVLLRLALDGTGELRVAEALDENSGGISDLAAAEHARLVVVDRDTRRIEFRHPLIRSAVVELSTAEERQRAHRELAKRWVDHPELQAWHLAEAATGLDETAAAQLEWLAERKLRQGDPVGAVDALTRAAELSPLAADRGRRFASAAYVGAGMAEALDDASRSFNAARDADPAYGTSLRAAITVALLRLGGEGDLDFAHRLLVGAINSWAEAGGGIDTQLDEGLRTLLMVAHYAARSELWEPFDRLLGYFKGRIPELLTVGISTLGDPARSATTGALGALDQMIEDLESADLTTTVRVAHASFFVDRLAGCRRSVNSVLEAARESGNHSTSISCLNLLGHEAYMAGRWDEARNYLGEAAALCTLHSSFFYAGASQYAQGILSAVVGDFDSARAISETIIQWAAPRGAMTPQGHAWHIRTMIALGEGDYERAFRAASAISPPGVLAPHVCLALFVPMDLVEAGVRAGFHSDAASHVTALREAEVGNISPRLALLVAASEAIIASEEQAPILFRRALSAGGTHVWPFDRARVLLLLGERLRRLRRMTEARIELAAAYEIFERLGATPWASRARNELRATGQIRKRQRDHAWESLTPQQRQIASLAASGLTNKQIGEQLYLSHRTVAGHLHRAFPILGISTRAGLRDALMELPEVDEGGPTTDGQS